MPKNNTFTISVAEILENHSDTLANSRQAVDDLLKSFPAPVQSSAKKRFQNLFISFYTFLNRYNKWTLTT